MQKGLQEELQKHMLALSDEHQDFKRPNSQYHSSYSKLNRK